jgi:hypothetical protein
LLVTPLTDPARDRQKALERPQIKVTAGAIYLRFAYRFDFVHRILFIGEMLLQTYSIARKSASSDRRSTDGAVPGFSSADARKTAAFSSL